MFAKFLPFSAGIPLAAALAIGYNNTASVKMTDAADASSRTALHATSQANGEALGATPVPKRSMKSRQTDNSMATLSRSSGTVTVGGQVMRPGPVRYSSGMTFWRAIEEVGGPTEFGSMRRVMLFRDGSQRIYDLTRAEWGNFVLKANDTIEVPQKMVFGS